MRGLFRLIKGLFKWLKPSHLSHGEGKKEFVPSWGIIIPHTKVKPGASSYDRKYSEYQYAKEMAGIIALPNATRDKGGVYGAASNLISRGVNCTIEPHFNAYNGHVSGSEILVLKGDKLSEHYARLFIEDFCNKYNRTPRHDNGIKFVSRGDRGYRNLVAAKDAGAEVAILTEMFFGDNYDDHLPFQEQAIFWENSLIPVADKPLD